MMHDTQVKQTRRHLSSRSLMLLLSGLAGLASVGCSRQFTITQDDRVKWKLADTVTSNRALRRLISLPAGGR